MNPRVLLIDCATIRSPLATSVVQSIGRQAEISRVSEYPISGSIAELLRGSEDWALAVVNADPAGPDAALVRAVVAALPSVPVLLILDAGRTLPSGLGDRVIPLPRDRIDELLVPLATVLLARADSDSERILESLPAAAFCCDRHQRLGRVNSAWTALTGIGGQGCLGRELAEFIHPEDRSWCRQWLRSAMEEPGWSEPRELRLPDTSAGGRCLELRVEPLRNSGAGVEGLVGTLTDISDRKADGERLFREKERARLTLESIAEGVITLDSDSRVEYLNPVAERFTGWSLGEARGQRLLDICGLVNTASGRSVLEQDNDQPLEQISGQMTLVRRDGEDFAVEISAAPLRDGGGSVLIFHDVTQTQQLAEMLSFQATHDALTGLLNRHEFERRLEWMLILAKEDLMEHSLMYLDLDQFKVINDTCGHVAGDELLRRVTDVLRSVVRDSDTVARLGGDEFGILLEYCPADKAVGLANRLREGLYAFRFVWDDKAFNISVSIGLVPVNHQSETLEQVLSAADSACYAAKEAGRNRVRVYQADDAELARRKGEMQWVSRITQALEQDLFSLYFQDIRALNPTRGQGRHCEILLRMHDLQGTMIPPGAFLPAAERYNLILTLDRWVVSHVLDWFSDHPQQLDKLRLCAINLSGHSFGDEEFLEFVAENFARSVVPPAKICFEITETAAISHMAKAVQFINRLKAIGCRFALDDFGAGMSSFAYLKTLPVDFLKIDGSFVKGIVTGPIDLAMLKSINEIGQVMGMKTVAEFVENDAIVARLREVGVDYAQGYGIARPRPLAEME